MQEINAWLQSNQNYEAGLLLYSTYGKSRFLKDLFTSGPTPYNIEKLETELKNLAPTSPAIIEVETQTTHLSDAIDKIYTQTFKSKSAEIEDQVKLLALKSERDNKYRQLERNMNVLDLSADKSVLHATAKQILLLHDQITDLWRQIDYFNDKGHFLFEKAKLPPKTDKIQLLHQSISRAKTRLKNVKCRNPKQTEKLIADKITQLLELKKSLDGKN